MTVRYGSCMGCENGNKCAERVSVDECQLQLNSLVACRFGGYDAHVINLLHDSPVRLLHAV
jgi:hypothetical protein